MKIDVGLVTGLVDSGSRAAEIEAMGFDGTFSFEGPHGPFAPLVLAAEHTTNLHLSTAIAVAFARNPMTTAQDAADLQRISRGRFTLGLGSQIRPHIERRYSMPWSRPAARMEEFVRAIRAIWASWSDGTPLDFRGAFYRHDLMTPFFVPGPNPHGDPPIALAAVGARMVEVAGRVADGLIVHPFHTPAFLTAETLPALRRGMDMEGRDRSAVEVTVQTMVAIGDDDDQVAQARQAAKAQLAFYGSTPAYRGMLDHHGFGDLQPRLRDLTREGRWAEMSSHVPDELVDLVCVSGTPAQLGAALRVRNAAADRTALVVYDRTGRADGLADVVAAFRSAG
jgi:probable F420-dependent oxidoreductase